jgi:RIO kinase 1
MPKFARKPDEKFKTKHAVFDDFTNKTIFKLISEGHFDGLESPLYVGKESNVFIARKEDKQIIVKIYRLETCDFNKMYDYIKEDPRYDNLRGKRRKIIFAWVQREFRNLLKAREGGVRVPKPITFQNNVLVMEFIGDNEPSQKLKNAIPKDPKEFLDDIVENMRRLYKAGLVHADLSPFNILSYNEKPVFIDFSQCTPVRISRGIEFLERDIHNIASFFRKIGIKADENEIKSRIIS